MPSVASPGPTRRTPDSSLKHADARAVEDGERRSIGGQIAVVLTGTGAASPQSVDVAECGADGGRRVVQQLQQSVVVHVRATVAARAPPWQADRSCPHLRSFAWRSSMSPASSPISRTTPSTIRFHVHDERHFVETYSLRQTWEVDLHPEEACGGPLDLHLALEVDPRTLLGVRGRRCSSCPRGPNRRRIFHFPLVFTWVLPPLPKGPDLLVLATEMAGVGGTDLPLEVSAIDSFASVTDAPERSLTIVARIEVGLDRIFLGQEQMCDVLDKCHEVSTFLLDRAPTWLDEL